MESDRPIRDLDLILVLQSFEICCHIEGACNSSWTLVQNMSVDHRCFDTLVSKKFLNCPYIIIVFKKVSRKGMPECVWCDLFLNSCFRGC